MRIKNDLLYIYLLFAQLAVFSASAQVATLNEKQQAELAKKSPITLIGAVVGSATLVDSEKMKPVPSTLPKSDPSLQEVTIVPLSGYQVGSLASVRVTKVLRTNENIKPGDVVQILVDKDTGSDNYSPTLVSGQQYIFMLSTVRQDDPRLNKNVFTEVADATGKGTQQQLQPFPRTGVYIVPNGFYGVVNMKQENSKLVQLIKEAVRKR
jgi:hypothetical protein